MIKIGMLLLFFLGSSVIFAQLQTDTKQVILVTTDNWENFQGNMHLIEKSNDEWKFVDNWPVVIGRSGLAWGKGTFTMPEENVLVKKEGDGKSPAGIFEISDKVYGYGEESPTDKLEYIQVDENWLGIDDSKSQYYNQVIDISKIEKHDWDSFEYMKRKDDLYKWVLVIEHNKDAISQGGSCIFIHLWRSETSPTSGCTAMTEENILKLIDWLDREKHPVVIQLPKPVYQAYSEMLRLPKLPLQEK